MTNNLHATIPTELFSSIRIIADTNRISLSETTTKLLMLGIEAYKEDRKELVEKMEKHLRKFALSRYNEERKA